MPHNPYNPAKPATPDVFVGRTALKRQLVAGLREGLNYSLTGDPGIGKTSLLLAVQRALVAMQDEATLAQIPLPVYVSFERNQDTLEKVLIHIFQAVTQAFASQRFLSLSSSFELWQNANERMRLGNGMKQLLDCAFDQEHIVHKPILLLDDLHRLNGPTLRYELMSVLQAMVNLQELGLTLVLTGQQVLTGELRNDTSPLRLLISHHRALANLTPAETTKLVTCATEHGWDVESGCDDLAYRLTSGHPYRLHYSLSAILADAGALSRDSLMAFHSPETLTYLNTLLHDGITAHDGLSVTDSEAKLTRIRELIREDDLEAAIDMLSRMNLPDSQQADLLAQRLSNIERKSRQGTLNVDYVSVARSNIAQSILRLLYPR